MPGNDQARLLAALEAALREAGGIARATARGDFKRWTKGADKSPVSEADIAVDDFLRPRLNQILPGAGWVSEESEAEPAAGALSWVVDPIDGTRAFIAGRADWSVSVALVENGRPLLAALYAPVNEEMLLAARSHGATCNGQRLSLPDGTGLAGARLAGPKRFLDRLVDLNPQILAQPKVFSLALRMARVAQGRLEAAFASPGSHAWDLAAADLLVHEAGGVMTDFAGKPLNYARPQAEQGALIAAGRARHAALIGLVRDRMAEFA